MKGFMLLTVETKATPSLFSQLTEMKPDNSICLIPFDPVHSLP